MLQYLYQGEIKINLLNAVAKRIEELLIKTGKTKYRLIKDSHLSNSTIQTILNGKSKSIRTSTIYLIAKSFGLSLNEFFNSPLFDFSNLKIK